MPLQFGYGCWALRHVLSFVMVLLHMHCAVAAAKDMSYSAYDISFQKCSVVSRSQSMSVTHVPSHSMLELTVSSTGMAVIMKLFGNSSNSCALQTVVISVVV